MSKLTKGLHWSTMIGEKILLAIIGFLTIVAAGLEIIEMYDTRKIERERERGGRERDREEDI